MKKGRDFLRNELNDTTYLESHPEIGQFFREVGCFKFCEKLQGFHQGVVEAFTLTFDGLKAKVGTFELQVDEALVALAKEIPGTGEKWFKTTVPKDIEFRSYLKPQHKCTMWQKYIPRYYLEKKWQQLFKAIQLYITCEGRYGRVMRYHFRLLNHFTGRVPLNLPYYLHKILKKMAQSVQVEPSKACSRLFHYGLIKLIILEELQRRGKTSGYILFWGEFETESQPKEKNKTSSQKSSTPRSSKRTRRAISPAEVEEPTSSSKPKKVKKKLNFSQASEGEPSIRGKNILNLPYIDSEEEEEPVQGEVPEQIIPEETVLETPGSEEKTLKDVLQSIKRNKSNKKVEELKAEVYELKLLDRVIKSQNEAIKKKSVEVRESFHKLAKDQVKLKRKHKKLIVENNKLYRVIKNLKAKLKLKYQKLVSQHGLEYLLEVAERLQE